MTRTYACRAWVGLVALALVIALAPRGAWAARPTGNETPKSSQGAIYSPCRHELSDGGEVYTKTSWEGEDYTVAEYIDTVVPATSTPNCRMDHMTYAYGLKFVHAHGDANRLLAESFSTEAYANTAAAAYVTAGWIQYPTANWEFQKWQQATYWSLLVHTRGMTNRFQDQNNTNYTISFMAACHSADWSGAWGGREYFGYNGTTNATKDAADSKTVWDLMTGITDDGNSRPAGVAYNKGKPYQGDLRHTSTAGGKTVLSPVVVDYFPKVKVCNDCYGYVKFDTNMNTAYTSEVMTVSGGAYLTNFSWNAAKDKLSFKITAVIPAVDYTFTVNDDRAVCWNQNNNLNGNQDPAGTDGRRPNKDDFVWTVTGDLLACDPAFVQIDRRALVSLHEARAARRARRRAAE